MPDRDSGNPTIQDHDKLSAERKLGLASSELAANILRIIRGAGKPEALVDQMRALLDVGFDYQDLAGYWPTDVIAGALKLESEYSEIPGKAEGGEVGEAAMDRVREERRFTRLHAEHGIRRGALQAIASRPVGQDLQQASGDREMRDGIEQIARLMDERRKENQQAARRAKAMSRPEKRRTGKAPARAKVPR